MAKPEQRAATQLLLWKRFGFVSKRNLIWDWFAIEVIWWNLNLSQCQKLENNEPCKKPSGTTGVFFWSISKRNDTRWVKSYSIDTLNTSILGTARLVTGNRYDNLYHADNDTQLWTSVYFIISNEETRENESNRSPIKVVVTWAEIILANFPGLVFFFICREKPVYPVGNQIEKFPTGKVSEIWNSLVKSTGMMRKISEPFPFTHHSHSPS